MMRALILCAGDATRWEGYLGVPKQLAPVDGVPILHRTVRLLRTWAPDAELVVVSKEQQQHLWASAGADRIEVAQLDPDRFEADRFVSSRHLWHPTGRTLIVYGDVYFTEQAMRTIATDDSPRWQVYGRPHASAHTGTPHGEIFALSWWPQQHQRVDAAVRYVIRLRQQGTINRALGWELLRALLGRTGAGVRHGAEQQMQQRMVVVDDMTEDFDKPKNYDAFMASWRRQRHGPQPARLSVAVMAHPARAVQAQTLADQLGAQVVWDDGGGEWLTAARAWSAYYPDATHHLVVQDDAQPVHGLAAVLPRIIGWPPLGDLCSLYFGRHQSATQHALVPRAAAAAQRADASWVVCPGTWWGVALAAPVEAIGDMLTWCTGRAEPYDMRLAYWCQRTGRDVWHTWPSLVEHADGPSLVRPGRAAGRKAWVLHDGPAAEFLPDGPVVHAGTNKRPSSMRPGSSVTSPAHQRQGGGGTMGLHDPYRQRKIVNYVANRRRRREGLAPLQQQPEPELQGLDDDKQPDPQQPDEDPGEQDQQDDGPPPEYGRGSGIDAWRRYLTSVGHDPQHLAGLSRQQLIDLHREGATTTGSGV